MKTILVTGSTDGVGRLVARRLAADGALVLLHGRDEARGRALLAEIEDAGGHGVLHIADLASLAEVRRLARTVLDRHPRLDVLINNAGIGFGVPGTGRELSAEGHELRFAVNYLAGFLLTSLLMPALKRAAPSRIVNVASAGQYPIDFADPMLERSYDGRRAYAQSKLAQIMATFDLAQQLAGTGVTVNALHPATFMDTTMVRQVGIKPASTVEEGADAILNLATSPRPEGLTGLYFNGLSTARANAQAYDEEARAKLKALSLRLVAA